MYGEIWKTIRGKIMSNGLIITNAYIVTGEVPNRVIKDGAVMIEDEHILDVGPEIDIQERYRGKYSEKIDACGRVVMPGLVNTHTHLYSTMARGISLKTPSPTNFVEILERLWWRLDKSLSLDDIYISALIPLIECIKHGTTTIIDHHASPFACESSLDKIEEAIYKTGIRASLCYEVSDRDGEAIAKKGIDENVRWLNKIDKIKSPFLSGLFGLHASLTLSDKTLVQCKEASMSLNSGFHIHVAEDLADQDDSLEKSGRSVVHRLNDFSILGPKTIAAHCVHIDEEEMQILLETETNVVHNPQSNMNNAVGACDVRKMLQRGITLGLGSDGMTSSMFEESRAAFLLYHHNMKDPSCGWQEIPRMLLENNAKIARTALKQKIGELSRGFLADVIIMDYYPPTPLAADNLFGHFIFGLTQATVDTTIVHGKVLMKKGELQHLDLKEISARCMEFSKKLWTRF